jgi:apolipoprotein N-acyltransferase
MKCSHTQIPPCATWCFIFYTSISQLQRHLSLLVLFLGFFLAMLVHIWTWCSDVRSLFLTIFPFLVPMVVFYIFVPKHRINDFPGHWGVSVMVIAIVFTIYELALLEQIRGCKSFLCHATWLWCLLPLSGINTTDTWSSCSVHLSMLPLIKFRC